MFSSLGITEVAEPSSYTGGNGAASSFSVKSLWQCREGFPGAARLLPRARAASRQAGRPEPTFIQEHSMYTARIKTHGDSMARSMTDVRNFKVFADEPPELGGRDGAPSPLEYILVAHGTCLNYMTFFIAKELGIPVRSTEIEVEASLDPAKFAGTDRSVRAG